MLRILLQYLLPLLLPFLAYLRLRPRWRASARGSSDAPWLALAAAGVGLLVVSLV